MVFMTITPHVIHGKIVDEANFCNSGEACSRGCKKIEAGLTRARLPQNMNGICVRNSLGEAPYCQCQYLQVNVPCNRAVPPLYKCDPSPSTINFCGNLNAGCDWACKKSYKGIFETMSNTKVHGICETTRFTDSVFSMEPIKIRKKTACVCYRNNGERIYSD
ncbi:hypothetical protein [Trichoplusia ni ascovirus 2c]|uniref:hypothetical protein n=1 Tax=Trichoplusia ni ascovirus 2c TaxID=328615 RepID=UPI0000E44218|nr:hypothetical protein TNAV2c_gp064 [Trichoplusia ni ascovirus 2c]ABF70581.1 hypothetical protein [Trichoplusia ni ascovirus 2c]